MKKDITDPEQKPSGAPDSSEETKQPRTSKPKTKALPAGVKISVKPISDIQFRDDNPRSHSAENLELIQRSITRNKAGRSILIDENDASLAGEGTTRSAIEAGIKEVIVIETTGDQLVAVKRSDLSEDQKQEMILFDNRANETSTWESQQMVAMLGKLKESGVEGDVFGFSKDDLKRFSDIANPPVKEDEASLRNVIDHAEELNKVWGVKLGDLWQIGDSIRILCGDSTNRQDVKLVLDGASPNLMVTDPPYGVNYEPDWRERVDKGIGERSRGVVLNDDRSDWTEVYKLFTGNVAYIWHGATQCVSVGMNIIHADFDIRYQIIWNKQHFTLSRGVYHWKHEACFYAVRKGSKASWISEDRTQSTVWDISNNNPFGDSNGKEETFGHSTQKPLECMARPIRNHAGDVYEPFAGAGTTLVAAHSLGRKCYAIELSPGYVAICLQRMTNLGLEAKRIE